MSPSFREVMEFRLDGTITSIGARTRYIPIDKLISDLFVMTDDKLASKMIKMFEKQLLLSKIDFKRFSEGLNNFYTETAEYIKENNLYKQYFDFCYFIYNELTRKEASLQAVIAYQDLLIQQYDYLSPLQTLIYGMSSGGELYLTSEPHPYLEYPLLEVGHKKDWVKKAKKSSNKIFGIYKRYGYNIRNYEELFIYFKDDQLLTNNIFRMAPFIDESTKDIFSSNFYLPSRGLDSITRIFKDTQFYYEELKNRANALPPGGVIGKYRNIGAGIKQVLYKEKIMYENMTPVLLFKVTFDDGTECSGFYDVKECQFYSPLFDYPILENFILENYWHLTCDVEIKYKRAHALHIIGKDKAMYPDQPAVEFITPTVDREYNRTGETRRFNREDYLQVMKNIKEFKRKLPEGMKASEEAKRLAREMGYILKEGETFVRPHKKTVYKKGE
jgi:hypothetical protein